MPYKIFKQGKLWKIRKIYNDDRKNYIVKKQYNERQKAINAAKAFVKFRRGIPVVRGNLVSRKKTKK